MLPKSTLDRIAKDAETKYSTFSRNSFGLPGNDLKEYIHLDDCKKLIEAEAIRAEELVNLLATIRDHLPPKTMFVKEITEALNNYNNIQNDKV